MPEEDITNETWEDNIKIHLGRTAQFKTIYVLESSWHQVFSVFILFGVDRGLTMGSKSYQTSERSTISEDNPELNKDFRRKVVKLQTGAKYFFFMFC